MASQPYREEVLGKHVVLLRLQQNGKRRPFLGQIREVRVSKNPPMIKHMVLFVGESDLFGCNLTEEEKQGRLTWVKGMEDIPKRRSHATYGEEILGRQVVLDALVGKRKTKKPFLVTIQEVKTYLKGEDELVVSHLAHFENGIDKWLTEEEMNGIKSSPRANQTKVVTTNKRKRSPTESVAKLLSTDESTTGSISESASTKKVIQTAATGVARMPSSLDTQQPPIPRKTVRQSMPPEQLKALALRRSHRSASRPSAAKETKPPPAVTTKLAPAQTRASPIDETKRKNTDLTCRSKNHPSRKRPFIDTNRTSTCTSPATEVDIHRAVTDDSCSSSTEVNGTKADGSDQSTEQTAESNSNESEMDTSEEDSDDSDSSADEADFTDSDDSDVSFASDSEFSEASYLDDDCRSKKRRGKNGALARHSMCSDKLDKEKKEKEAFLKRVTSPNKLQGSSQWVEDLKVWMATVRHGKNNTTASVRNTNRVASKLQQLASGKGLTCKHWKKGVVFCKGIKVDPSYDLDELWEQATDLERIYGEDQNGGYSIKHPLKKLMLYKDYLNRETELLATVSGKHSNE